jgi:DNA-binding MarR family transcriptional regulator
LADRNVRRRYIESIITRSGVELSVVAAWLLIKIEQNLSIDLSVLARQKKIDIDALRAGFDELVSKGLVLDKAEASQTFEVSDKGCDILNRLADARRNSLAEIVSEWSPDQRAEIADNLQRLAQALVPGIQPKRHG